MAIKPPKQMKDGSIWVEWINKKAAIDFWLVCAHASTQVSKSKTEEKEGEFNPCFCVLRINA